MNSSIIESTPVFFAKMLSLIRMSKSHSWPKLPKIMVFFFFAGNS